MKSIWISPLTAPSASRACNGARVRRSLVSFNVARSPRRKSAFARTTESMLAFPVPVSTPDSMARALSREAPSRRSAATFFSSRMAKRASSTESFETASLRNAVGAAAGHGPFCGAGLRTESFW